MSKAWWRLEPVWNVATTTVALVVTGTETDVNVQSAEWTYFVEKDPLCVAVVLLRDNLSAERLARMNAFTVTFCSQYQAGLASFCGSFSGRDHDKPSSDAIALEPGTWSRTPWVRNGVLAAECEVRHRLELPNYDLVVGEVREAHRGSVDRPLVKRGAMYELGSQLRARMVTAGLQMGPGSVTVFATSSSELTNRYTVRLLCDGDLIGEFEFDGDEYGDLNETLSLRDQKVPASYSVEVHLPGFHPGFASARQT